MTGDEWNAEQEAWKKTEEKMAKMDLHRRLKEFAREHPDFKMPPLLVAIRGIFKMRNCLLHNNGIVARSYCHEPDGLRIRFWRFSVWVLDVAGEHEYTEGEIVRSGQRLQVRLAPAERIWRIGERIVLCFLGLCVMTM